jgi:UDP-N-acetylmuramoyl-L-alanyl-D-glutamate--2,6-diaminopimelate ligase
MLREIADAGCRWAVIEATSHGLALQRLDACDFDIAAVTCVGADHMDFHGTAEAYVAAKGRLFEMLDESPGKGMERAAVLNADDPSFAYLKSVSGAPVVTYGLTAAADVAAFRVREEGWSSMFSVSVSGEETRMTVPKPGIFNVSNALAATAVCLRAGLDLAAIAAGIASWPGAPGRMEFVDEGQPFTVVVDFAHSPDALRRVLELLRSRSRGRIIAVFGSIGERERDRRAAMGHVAAAAADFTIVTDDNPYTEDRDVILREIASGLTSAGLRQGHDFAVIADRREAIAHALGMAVDEDVVLLAGKGHEREVHLAGSTYDCDDREVARRWLRSASPGGSGFQPDTGWG